MKKEFGKWLMDIAKYVVTVVILSSVFGTVEKVWVILTGGWITAIVALLCGLFLIKEPEKKRRKKHGRN
jgi:hypothetical protein